MITAKDGSLYDRTLVNPDYKDFAPRLGLAYSVDPKTVIRGGYGISYVHFNRLGSADELGINGPQVIFVTINQNRSFRQPYPRHSSRRRAASRPASTIPPEFQSGERQYRLHPDRHPLALHSDLVHRRSSASWPRTRCWSWLTTAITARACRSSPITTRLCPISRAKRLGIQARRPNQAFGAITWVDPAGISKRTTVSRRAWSIALRTVCTS